MLDVNWKQISYSSKIRPYYMATIIHYRVAITLFYIFTLLTKMVTRFSLNILNNAHLLKNDCNIAIRFVGNP